MNQCPRCGAHERFGLASFGQAGPVGYICENGHRFGGVQFRPWRGEPYHYVVKVKPMAATFSAFVGPPEMGDSFEQRTVHCGPPADLPAVPTPGEIMRGAGLGHLVGDTLD